MVRPAHDTAVVRTAEAAANGAHGDATMMRRASFGLASVMFTLFEPFAKPANETLSARACVAQTRVQARAMGAIR